MRLQLLDLRGNVLQLTGKAALGICVARCLKVETNPSKRAGLLEKERLLFLKPAAFRNTLSGQAGIRLKLTLKLVAPST